MQSNCLKGLILLIFPLLTLFSCGGAISEETAEAEKGIISLSLKDLGTNVFSLEGNWEFYWGQYLSSEDFKLKENSEPNMFIQVPGSWQIKNKSDETFSAFGYATLRLTVKLPERERNYGLMISTIAPTYNIFINGKLHLSVGNPSMNLDEIKEENYTGTSFFSAANEAEIIIHISNRSEKIAGISRRIYFGDAETIARYDSLNMAMEALILGVILIIGIFHFIYWVFQTKNLAVLYFALFCILIALRTSIESIHLLNRLLPELSWEFVMKLNFLTYFYAVPVIYCFFMKTYPQTFNHKIAKWLWTITSLLSIPVLLLNMRHYDFLSYVHHGQTLTAFVLIVIGVVRAVGKKRPGTKIQLTSLIIFILTAVNDILFTEGLIITAFVSRYGLLLIILTQAYLIGQDYSHAYQGMRKLLKERQHAQIQLEEKVKERTSQLEKSNEAKTAFLRNMSHEMRTPINGIMGFAELLTEVSEVSELPYYSSLILDESDHLLNLINQLLDLSKIEAGKLQVMESEFNFREAVCSVEPAVRVQAEHKGLDFSISVDPLLPALVIGDRVRYRQILFNLLSNSLKFTEKGHISLTVRRESDDEKHVVVYTEVRDTGIGIPEEKQPKIFNLFEQADSSSNRRFGGTGLGTAIARELAKMMGGDINFHSEENAGSAFWFTVVFSKTDTKLSMPIKKEKEVVSKESGSILLVEDYPTNQKILKQHLEGAGYAVQIAENGKEALNIFAKYDFDAVIMDIQMPVMDGYEATRKLRTTDKGKDLPIIGLTASAFEEDKSNGLKAGMNDVLTKPVRKAKLLSFIKETIKKN